MEKTWKAELRLAAVIAVVTFFVYLPAIQNGFVEWDDSAYIFENSHIRSFNKAFFKWAFFDFYAGNWHPLTWISHAGDYALWRLNPMGHHLTSIILHAFNTFVVVFLIIRLFCKTNETALKTNPSGFLDRRSIFIIGGVAGLLFGLHPLHVESVAWVAERKDLLSASFFLLSILMYTYYIGSVSSFTIQSKKSVLFFYSKHYLLTLAFFVLALLSKPMAVSLPFVLLILDWHFFNRISTFKTFLAAFKEKLPFIALSLSASILAVISQKSGGTLSSLEKIPLITRLLVSTESLMAYLGKMLLPLNLVPFYPYPKSVSLVSLEYLFSILLAIGITAACVAIVKKQKFWLMAWGYYVVTLMPVIGIVQIGCQSMADRYTYLPSIGPFLVFGVVASRFAEKINVLTKKHLIIQRSSTVLAVLLLTVLSFLTVKQIAIWENSIVLWSYVIDKYPHQIPQAYNNRGLAYENMRLVDRAIEDYDQAIAVEASFYRAYINRGLVLDKRGQHYKAIADYDKAIALNPSAEEAYNNRGLAFYLTGQHDKAIADLDMAIALNPTNYKTYANRGLIYENLKQLNKATEDYEKTIILNPSSHEAYHNLGTLYFEMGSFEKAVEYADKSIAIKPNNAGYYSDRGAIYFQLGQLDRALEDFNQAIKLDQNRAEAYFNRGTIYLLSGDKQLARSDFQKACNLGVKQACK